MEQLHCKGTMHIGADELWDSLYKVEMIVKNGTPMPEDMLLAIFRHVVGSIMLEKRGYASFSWERVEKLEGYPKVDQYWWTKMCNHFVELNRKYYTEKGVPDYRRPMPGGVWMNWGFSVDEAPPLADTIVCDFYIQYKSE